MFASQKLERTLVPITRSYTSSDAPGLRTQIRIDRGIADHDIDAAALRDGLIDQVLQFLLARDMARNRQWPCRLRRECPVATASHASGLRLETTTVAPCSAMRLAMARPIPLVEPVTMATLPVRSNSDDMRRSPVLAWRSGDP